MIELKGSISRLPLVGIAAIIILVSASLSMNHAWEVDLTPSVGDRILHRDFCIQSGFSSTFKIPWYVCLLTLHLSNIP